MATDFDTSKPGDTDFASQFPNNERGFRSTIQTFLEVDHDVDGHHAQVTLPAVGDPPTFADGSGGIYNIAGSVVLGVGAGPFNPIDSFPSGTVMMFLQAAPPPGWTLSATANDRVLRVNGTSGGALGGNWVMSGITVSAHVLTIGELPAHTHTVSVGTSTVPGVPGGGFTSVSAPPSATTTGSVGSGTGHDHGAVASDGTWRPAYADVVVGVKN